MNMSPHALLRLLWVSCAPSLYSKLILEALGCSRISKEESTGSSPALPGSAKERVDAAAGSAPWLGAWPCDQRCELSRAGGWAPRMP